MATAWYVIRTATRQEERAMRTLAEHGYGPSAAYCPRETRWWRLGRTRTTRTVPLLPGYLFVQAEASELWRIEDLDGVHAVLRRSGQGGARLPVAIPAAFVGELRAAEAAGVFDRTRTPAGVRIERGAQVRIAETSALAGWVGEIVTARRNGKVAVLLSMIGNRPMPPKTVEVPARDLEPVERKPAA